MATIARELSGALDLGKLIQAGYSLLLAEDWNPRVTIDGSLSKTKTAEILTIIYKLLSLAMSEGQMREFLVCFPIKSSRDQLAFIDVGKLPSYSLGNEPFPRKSGYRTCWNIDLEKRPWRSKIGYGFHQVSRGRPSSEREHQEVSLEGNQFLQLR